MKVLIADDDRATCLLLATTLERAGMTTVTANNGLEAYELFEDEEPHVIISDWQMPTLNGLELCQRIRKASQRQYTYFILITAQSESSINSRAAIEYGVDDILRKPLDPEAIWMRLHVAERILRFTHEVSELKTLLPICSYCKRVRDDESYWQQIEQYFRENVGTEFTHSVCPECYEQLMRARDNRLKKTQALDEVADAAKARYACGHEH